MITKLSNNNIAFFDKLIPNDELDNLISRPDYFGIGVSRYVGTEEIPAGVLIYRLVQDASGLMPASIEITYLFVEETQRRRCVGSDLICRLFDVATRNKIEIITADTLADDEHNGLREFLGGWHFDFSVTHSEEFYTPIRNIDISSVVLKIARKNRRPVSSLSNVTQGQFNEFKNRLRRNFTEGIDYAFYETGMDYYDKDVSKVIIQDNTIIAAILAHRNIGGLLVVDLLKWLPPATDTDILGLIATAHESAENKYSSDVYVSARIRSDFAAALVDDIAPEQGGIPIFRAMLNKDEEVTSEDWIGAKEIMRSILEDSYGEESQ